MRYLLLISTLFIAINLSAQRGGERGNRGEKIEQQRIAFITTELDLTVDEAQAFWPLYNEYSEAKNAIKDDKVLDKKIEDMTEQESKQMLTYAMESKRRSLDLETKFMNSLENVLSANKRLKLIRLEREFKKKILKRYQKRLKRGEKQYRRLDKKKEKEKSLEEGIGN